VTYMHPASSPRQGDREPEHASGRQLPGSPCQPANVQVSTGMSRVLALESASSCKHSRQEFSCLPGSEEPSHQRPGQNGSFPARDQVRVEAPAGK
jgi:hypothetical protein